VKVSQKKKKKGLSPPTLKGMWSLEGIGIFLRSPPHHQQARKKYVVREEDIEGEKKRRRGHGKNLGHG